MDASPFGKLSAEIRNQIYDLALPSSTTVGVHTLSSVNRMSRRNYDFEHPLTSVCRQMRAEVKPMFYARNMFSMTIQHRQYYRLKTWLDLVGPEHLRLVRGLTVGIHERDCLMLLAVREVVELLGPKGIVFRIREHNLGTTWQPGRRIKGHGRYPKKGWTG